MSRLAKLVGVIMLLTAPLASAADFLPFKSDSRAAIEKSYGGKPLILTFWSVDCAYCADDLKLLGDIVRQNPEITLVTVSTDNQEMAVSASKVLNKIDLPPHKRWQFAESDTERLRYNIDRKWYGELPRTYFYDAQHQVRAVSGKPDGAWLEQWLGKLPAVR